MIINITNKLLVVLYKISPTESPTIQSIINFFSTAGMKYSEESELIIWDNSPASYEAEVEVFRRRAPMNVSYTHTPENTSLSRIYNLISTKIENNEYLTLLDQDSFLTIDYFNELRKAQLEGYSLILPMVKCGGILVSPGTRFFCKGKLLKNVKPGVIASKNLLAINSGMSAKARVFKKIHYDERLLFYGTDTYFMKHYEKHFSHAYVINASINHSLAENDSETSVERKNQIGQARRDAWKIVFSETLTERIFLFIYERTLILRKWFRGMV